MTPILIGLIVLIVFWFLSALLGFLLEKTYTEEERLSDRRQGIYRFYQWKRDISFVVSLLILLGLLFL